jgi:hypothetical protein
VGILKVRTLFYRKGTDVLIRGTSIGGRLSQRELSSLIPTFKVFRDHIRCDRWDLIHQTTSDYLLFSVTSIFSG